MNIEKELKGTKGSTTNKVRKLQKQYNKILVDLFDQFAAESIEEALDQNEGSFGENIQSIVQCALDCLKGKVMEELGVKDISGEVAVAIGGIGMPEVDEGEPHADDETEEDHEEHEAEETSEEEAEEHAEGEDEKEEKDEELEEKAPPGGKKVERMIKHIKKSEKESGKSADEAKKIAFATAWKKHNESDESMKRDKVISANRRSDQVSLTEAYVSMYSK